MKLPIGCLVLGCIFAVLVVAEEPVTETVETTPELTTAIVDATSEPERQTKIFAKPDQTSGNDPQHEVYILPDHSNGHHDDHHHHHHPTEPPHHHHHQPPPHHHHPPPPHPPHHHHYPPYYQSYYPPPYPYGSPVYGPVPQPYPYYPSPQYHQPPPHMHVKPITVIQTETDSNSGNGHNFVKPVELIHQSTGYLWNLIDQKNNELWNLFGNKHSGNGGGGDKDENVVHEVVVSYEKPGVGTTIGTVGQPNGGNWFYKGKNIARHDCNTTK